MKNIRKGNDITIKWFLSIDNGRMALAEANLSVYIIDAWGKKTPLTPAVHDEYIELKYYGIRQGKLGVYRLTAILNEGEIGQAVVDECEVFRLVGCSHEEEGEDNANLNCESVTISSAMSVGTKGMSAYEIWLNNGHEGTEEDFLAWLQNKPEVEEIKKQLDEINGVNDTTDTIDTLPEMKKFFENTPNNKTMEEVLDEADESFTDDDITNAWNQVFGNENTTTDNNPSAADE